MPSSPTPFVLGSAGWRARLERLLDGVARQRLAISLLAVLALAAAGALWYAAQPRAADPPPAQAAAGATGSAVLPRAGGSGSDGAAGAVLPGSGPSANLSAGPSAGPGAATIAVDVVGRVRRPGLVNLPVGSRVVDAVNAAGGAAPGAQLDAVNLARKLVDGEQIRIPRQGERLAPSADPGAGSGGAGSGGAGAAQPGVPLDLNTATAEQLDTLPGVGEVTANQIIAYRDAHPFTSVDDLRQVPGIGDRRFELLKDLVTVSGTG
jgi:competence protein ComEA